MERDIAKISLSTESLQSALKILRDDFNAHIHDGMSSRAFQIISVETIQARTVVFNQSPVAETIVPDKTITVNVNGTNYKIPIKAA